jgi:hypothetical protein
VEAFRALVITKGVQSQAHSLVRMSGVQLEKTEREFAFVSTVNGAQINVVRSDFEICLGNVSPDFRTSGIRGDNVQHQATVAVEGNFEEVEGVELLLVVVFNGTNPLAHKSVLLRHSEREAEQYENSNTKQNLALIPIVHNG